MNAFLRVIAVADRADVAGLAANVFVALAAVTLVDGAVFATGSEGGSAHAPAFLPPPHAIAAVWCALFGCMAVARWELVRAGAARRERTSLFVLFVLCATFPVYTLGLRNDIIGEIASVGILWFAATLVRDYAGSAPRGAAWLLPLCAWLAFASVAGAFTLLR